MNERIKPDFTLRIDVGEEEDYLLDPKYDFIRVFPFLGYGILNIVVETGVHRLYTTEEQCRIIAQRGIPLVELEWITESENERMREIMADDLENWMA